VELPESIKATLEIQSIQEWNLSQNLLTASPTDNVVAAMGILKWLHIQYFGHALQLAVNKAVAIPAISRACVRGRRLVSHFHHSTNSSYLLI